MVMSRNSPMKRRAKTFSTDAGIAATHSFVNRAVMCPCCGKSYHDLDKCYFFIKMPISDRENFIRTNNLCFGSLKSTSHRSRDCKDRLTCTTCYKRHPSSLHKSPTFDRPSRGNRIGQHLNRDPTVSST